MSFQVRLVQPEVSVEPGAHANMSVEIINEGHEPDLFELAVEGIDPEWVAIPVPTFTIGPEKTNTEKVMIHPPRAVESVAGTFSFVVRVRSLNSGEQIEVPASLEVSHFHHLSLDVSPKKGLITTANQSNTFTLTVLNLGNSDHTVQFVATDTDDELVFDFEPGKVQVGPGQEKTVSMTATSNRRPLFANSRLFGFSVTARSSAMPSVAASSQGQLEQRALASPGFVVSILLALTVLALWIWSFPKPPSVDLALSAEKVELGKEINFDWQISNAKTVRLMVDGALVKKSFDSKGTFAYVPTVAREYVVSAIASEGRRESAPVTRKFVVIEPPKVPEPEIFAFRAKTEKVTLGSKVLLEYAINESVTSLILYPNNMTLDPSVRATEIEVDATREGDVTYTLVAKNAKGVDVQKSLRINVVRATKANIIAFRSSEVKVTDPAVPVTLEWQISNAIRAEIFDGKKTETVDARGGQMSVVVDKTTTFVLTAFDADGLTAKRVVKVVVVPPANPPANPNSQGTGPDPNGPPTQPNPIDNKDPKPPGSTG